MRTILYLSFCIIVKNHEILGGPIHYPYHNMIGVIFVLFLKNCIKSFD